MNDWELAEKLEEVCDVADAASDEQVKKLNADAAFKLRDISRAWKVMADIKRGIADHEEVRQLRKWAKGVLDSERAGEQEG